MPQMEATQKTTLANFISILLVDPSFVGKTPRPDTAGRLSPHESLFAADGEAVDADGRSCDRSAELQVVGDLGNIEEQFFQVSCDCDFFHRIRELAAGDPQSGG